MQMVDWNPEGYPPDPDDRALLYSLTCTECEWDKAMAPPANAGDMPATSSQNPQVIHSSNNNIDLIEYSRQFVHNDM